MTEQGDVQAEYLSVEVQQPSERQAVFSNLGTLCGYVSAFGIENCNIRSGINQHGSKVYVVTYASEEIQ